MKPDTLSPEEQAMVDNLTLKGKFTLLEPAGETVMKKTKETKVKAAKLDGKLYTKIVKLVDRIKDWYKNRDARKEARIDKKAFKAEVQEIPEARKKLDNEDLTPKEKTEAQIQYIKALLKIKKSLGVDFIKIPVSELGIKVAPNSQLRAIKISTKWGLRGKLTRLNQYDQMINILSRNHKVYTGGSKKIDSYENAVEYINVTSMLDNFKNKRLKLLKKGFNFTQITPSIPEIKEEPVQDNITEEKGKEKPIFSDQPINEQGSMEETSSKQNIEDLNQQLLMKVLDGVNALIERVNTLTQSVRDLNKEVLENNRDLATVLVSIYQTVKGQAPAQAQAQHVIQPTQRSGNN